MISNTFSKEEIEKLLNLGLEFTDLNVIDNALKNTTYVYGDMDLLVKCLICNMTFREKFLTSIDLMLIDYVLENNNSTNILRFKWNLFLKILKELEIGSISSNSYQLLEKTLNINTEFSLVDAFFWTIKNDLLSINSIYSLLSKTSTIERSGWILSNIPTKHLESIAEHMYNMYYIALLYLPYEPSTIKLDKMYKKTDILRMCMLHDIAETLIGDIPKPKKTSNDDKMEDILMKSILCGLLYNQVEEAYHLMFLWDDFCKGITCNGKIARDLDIIQLDYQLLTYALLYPNVYDNKTLEKWLERKPKTQIGLDIYEKLILKNQKFEIFFGKSFK